MLNLVDSFGASFIVFILAIGEVTAVCWFYGKIDRTPNILHPSRINNVSQ